MRYKARIKPFLEELGKIWEAEAPDWRFGQLISNLEREYGDLFLYQDNKMLDKIKQYFKNINEEEK